MSFQQNQLPSTLNKFRSYGNPHGDGKDKDDVYNLLRGRFRFSRMQSFNDPFEGRPATVPAFTDPAKQRAAVLKYFVAALREKHGLPTGVATHQAEKLMSGKTLEEMRQIAQDATRKIPHDDEVRLFCMSGPKALAAPLTWSHYADCHRGVCIHFSTTQAPMKFAYSINYSENYPEVVFPRTEGDNWASLERGFLWKSSLWSYEEEYRLIRHGHRDGLMAKELALLMIPWDGDHGIASPSIVEGITFGVNMPQENREELNAWISDNAPHVTIWEASLHNSRYEILRQPVR